MSYFAAQNEVDALVYVDKEYATEEMQALVQQMISEEMKQFTPSDYLKNLPYPDFKFGNGAVKESFDRLVNAGYAFDKIDFLKSYENKLARPSGALAKDLQAWRKSIASAKIQNEINANQLLNLELLTESAENLKKSGVSGVLTAADIWLNYNKDCTDIIQKHLLEESAQLKRKIEEVNTKRFTAQEAAGRELEKLAKRKKSSLEKVCLIQEKLNSGI